MDAELHRPPAPPEMPLRERLHAYVRRRPATHILEIAAAFRLSHPTIMYHLALLADEGYILSMMWGRRRVHFDTQAHYTSWERELLATLAREEPRAIIERIARGVPTPEGTAKRHAADLVRLRALRPGSGALRLAAPFRARARRLLAKLPPDAPQAACLGAVAGS